MNIIGEFIDIHGVARNLSLEVVLFFLDFFHDALVLVDRIEGLVAQELFFLVILLQLFIFFFEFVGVFRESLDLKGFVLDLHFVEIDIAADHVDFFLDLVGFHFVLANRLHVLLNFFRFGVNEGLDLIGFGRHGVYVVLLRSDLLALFRNITG